MRANSIITVKYTFWTLQSRHFQPHHSHTYSKNGQIAPEPRNLPKMVEKRFKCTAVKILGNSNLDKLRIIVLFEVDFNYNNKRVDRAVMWSVEVAGGLEQYGSRKHKLANLQCLNKRLLYNLVQFCQQPMALCSNDAKSCYDWIVLTVAALCLCQAGIPLASVASMVQTLHNMHHYTRMAFGNLTISQGQHKWGKPIEGIGQGNGTGPQIWAAVSSPLFEIL